ncbi:MAG: N-6 DNA methylase [Elusimicrobiota bacterium]|nr:N-6 DNA methylase [Elusimicrobiota bacterium]
MKNKKIKTQKYLLKENLTTYNANTDTFSKVQEPELSLFQEKIKIDNNISLTRLHKTLHNLLKLFVDNSKRSSNTKIFLKTNNIDNGDKFIVESAILYLGKIILMKYCKDNDFLKVNFKCDLYESVNEFYDFFGKTYYKLETDELYSEYIPPQYLNDELIDVLDRYDFTGIDIDIIGKLYENFISKEEKILLGQVYTPDEVVDYILKATGYTTDLNLENKKIIDISCGAGVFLVRAVKILINGLKLKGSSTRFIYETVQNNIWGMEINPFSLKLAELNLLISTFELLSEVKRNHSDYCSNKFNLYQTNSVNKNDQNDIKIVNELKNRKGIFADGFDYVVGNPPYLEAKKMPSELKDICRKSFSDIANGAFDLYFCFIKLGIELLSENGSFGFIIPNKFQILKSAKTLRKSILDNYTIQEITDISNLPVFKDISVYPILLFIRNQKSTNQSIRTYDEVDNLLAIEDYKPSTINQSEFYKTEGLIFFTLPSNKTGINIYKKLSSIKTHLKDYLDIRWTISFHRSGIINNFIFNTPTGKNPKPILGANIHSRDAEIEQYKVNWSGLWIDYDVEKARLVGNSFPPIEIFETPKLIIRQNAEKLSVAIDNRGKWILKDVYFSGRLIQKAKNDGFYLEYIAAILNSKLMNYYYSILFKGGHVNGGYLHFLIGYLNALPMINSNKQEDIKKMVSEINISNNHEIRYELDKLVCNIFELNKNEIKLVMES